MLRYILVAVSLGLCVLAGAQSVPQIGLGNAAIFASLLAYLFALSLGANLALTAIMRPPFQTWKALMPAVFCFAPMLLGFFPVSSWWSHLGPIVGWNNLPPISWLVVLLGLGFCDPRGILFATLRLKKGSVAAAP